MAKIKSLLGLKFGRLLVVEFSGQDKNRNSKWKCQCDCGTIKIILGVCLKDGSTVSCGCYRKEINRAIAAKNAKPEGEAALNELFRRYKRGAKNRNLEFLLDKTTFLSIVTQRCHYCNRPSSQKAISRVGHNRKAIYGNVIYSGIDRKNNGLGYTEGNSIPCCRICNRAKADLTYEEFIEYIDAMSFHRMRYEA